MDTVQLNIFNIQTYKYKVWENSRLNIYMFYNDTVSFLSYLFIFYQYRNDHFMKYQISETKNLAVYGHW